MARVLDRYARTLRALSPGWGFRPARALASAVLGPIRFSRASGHWRSSLAERAVTRDGEPIPWYTYPAIDFLSQRDFNGKHVLEFGGGQSTLFWARRAASVLTIEENEGWFRELRSKVERSANVAVHHVPVDVTTRSIAQILAILQAQPIRKFDVIVVDGHLRPELTAAAFDYLAPRGCIILDNAEGYGFYDVTKSRACRRVDFFGFSPGVARQHCTAVVFVDDCFLLEPTVPIANVTGID